VAAVIIGPGRHELDGAALGRQVSGLQSGHGNAGERRFHKETVAARPPQTHEERETSQQQQLPLGSQHDFRRPQGTHTCTRRSTTGIVPIVAEGEWLFAVQSPFQVLLTRTLTRGELARFFGNAATTCLSGTYNSRIVYFMIRASVANYIRLGALVCALVVIADGQAAKTTRAQSTLTGLQMCAPCVHAHMDFLASDALRGRGSGTPDELVAATYIASELEQYGVAPAGDDGTYLQRATLLRQKLTSAPQLKFHTSGPAEREVAWTHGKEILALYLANPSFSGPLQKIDLAKGENQRVQSGGVVFLTAPHEDKIRREQLRIGSQGALAVLVPESSRLRLRWEPMGSRLPELPVQIEGADRSDMGPQFSAFAVSREAGAVLSDLPDGTTIEMKATAGPVEKSHTWNAVGEISGTDSSQQHAVVLLTAHLDHLGVGAPVNGDDIYNGADDDASGATAVLELARVLASQPKPRRTVIFALFGSEETGGLGSTYFREHLPVPLHDISACLEFEMIGRADPAVAEDTLWLTGWERSNLGPELARHGAHLVADPHPDQGFFRRSDNYVFAKKGVVAQTVSSYGLHGDYHQPSDDLAHIDFKHMNEAIHSMLKPVLWLVNSAFAPHWNRGGQP